MGLLVGSGPDTDGGHRDHDPALGRLARNMKTRLEFIAVTDRPAGRGPMNSLLLLNGSPRGKSGNTPILLSRVTAGWEEASGPTATSGTAPGEATRMLHLARPSEFEAAVAAFGEADTVILGMPLYTDAMPARVKEFIEQLQPYVGREDNPRLGFLIQSGFAEALHSRHLERYLEKLARRLGCEYPRHDRQRRG